MDELLAAKERLQADGVEVVGPNDHTLFKSIYFCDPSGPSGHRLELAVNTGTPERAAKAGRREVGHVERVGAHQERAPKQAAWLHDGSHQVSPSP